MRKYLFTSLRHFIAGGKNSPCRQVWHSLSHFKIFFSPTSFPLPNHFATTKVFGWVAIWHYRSPLVPTYYQPAFWLLGHHDFACKDQLLWFHVRTTSRLYWVISSEGLPWVIWHSGNWQYNDMWCSRGIQRQRHMVFTCIQMTFICSKVFPVKKKSIPRVRLLDRLTSRILGLENKRQLTYWGYTLDWRCFAMWWNVISPCYPIKVVMGTLLLSLLQPTKEGGTINRC